MNFSYEGASLDKIIKKYSKKDFEYFIQYLDGSSSLYISDDIKEEDKIKELMLAQAIEREEKFKKGEIDATIFINMIGSIISCAGVSLCNFNKLDLLKLLFFSFLVVNLCSARSNKKKLKELKKYKMFLELINELSESELNSSKYTKAYEAENIYAKTLNINTVDEFSLGEIKSIYNVYIKEKSK